jgi:hypothetical protein
MAVMVKIKTGSRMVTGYLLSPPAGVGAWMASASVGWMAVNTATVPAPATPRAPLATIGGSKVSAFRLGPFRIYPTVAPLIVGAQ